MSGNCCVDYVFAMWERRGFWMDFMVSEIYFCEIEN